MLDRSLDDWGGTREVYEISYYWIILNKCVHKISNEEVLDSVREKTILRRMRRSWIVRHTLRHGDLLKNISRGEI